MKRYITNPVTTPPPKEPQDAASVFDIDKALSQCEVILGREITNLMIESSGKKLSPTSAKDLVSYLKLLHEIKTEKVKELSNMTDEELETLTKQNP